MVEICVIGKLSGNFLYWGEFLYYGWWVFCVELLIWIGDVMGEWIVVLVEVEV